MAERYSFWKEVKRTIQVELLDRIQQSKRFSNLMEVTDFALPMKSWQKTSHVIGSILIASLMINLLSLVFPLTLLQIYDRIIPNVAINTLVLLVIAVGIALVLEAILKIARSYVGGWADAKFEHCVGSNAFKRVLESSTLEFERAGTGQHMKSLNSINTLRDFYSGQAIIALVDLPFIVILLLLIAYIAGWLVIVPIVMLIVYLSLAVRNAKFLKKMLDDRQDQDERRSNFIIETLSNIHTVKSVTLEAQMLRRYERLQRTSAISDHNVSLQGGKSMSMGMSISQMTIIMVVAVGSTMVIQGNLTIGGLAACTLLSGRCLQPVNMIISLWTRLQSVRIAREDLDRLLAMPQESAQDAPEMSAFQGGVTLKDVSFRYSDTSDWLLRHVNLELAPKDAISITGGGLGGKSTLTWLIMGLLKPTEGTVLLDGKDLSRFNASSVRRKITYLPQHSVLFSGTVLENLTMFDEEAYRIQAQAAADITGLSAIIDQLPKGYETMVADQAIESLPRGVNQLIAITRSLVLKPSLLIFDEANVALDMRSDAFLNAALKRIVGHCSMIIISHRPSILNLAKKHYTLNQGVLKEIS